MKQIFAALAGMALLAAGLPTTVRAAYPDRPIRAIIPTGPGGAADILGRIYTTALSKVLKQNVVVENLEGGTGDIGIERVTQSAPDGYTLCVTAAIPVVITPALSKNYPVDPNTAFTPIARFAASDNYVMVVNPSLPVKSVHDLIDYVKANPGKLVYASGGIASINQLAVELFKVQAGIDILHVPYSAGAGAAVIAVMGNEAQLMISSSSGSLAQVKAGRLRAIAVTSPRRLPDLPDVPTLAEQGFPDYHLSVWYGVLGPKGMPPELVNTIVAATQTALADPAVQASFVKLGAAASFASPAELKTQIASDLTQWKDVAKKAHLAPQ